MIVSERWSTNGMNAKTHLENCPINQNTKNGLSPSAWFRLPVTAAIALVNRFALFFCSCTAMSTNREERKEEVIVSKVIRARVQ